MARTFSSCKSLKASSYLSRKILITDGIHSDSTYISLVICMSLLLLKSLNNFSKFIVGVFFFFNNKSFRAAATSALLFLPAEL